MPEHQIQAYMTKSPVVVERTTNMAQALKIMSEQGFKHLPVMAAGKLVGVVSEHELKIVDNMQAFDKRLCVVGDFIVCAPYTVRPDVPLREVARAMAENRCGSAVVVDGERVIGVFTATDALRALATLAA